MSMAKSWLKSTLKTPQETTLQALPRMWREVKAMTDDQLIGREASALLRREAGIWSPYDELILLELDRRKRETDPVGESPLSKH